MPELRDTDFAPARFWRGRWIWAPGPGREKNSYWYFRKEFDLNAAPAAAALRITADTRYKLFVNGELVAQGPPLSQPYFMYFDTHDAARLLRSGRNCVAVLVYHIGHFQDARGGLLLELDADGEPLTQTDASWKVLRSPAWAADTHYFGMNKVTPYQEVFDSRREPPGWTEPGFDDRGWPAARVVDFRGKDRPPAVCPWSKLIPRDIPAMEETPLRPAAIAYAEECLAIDHRGSPLDLSLGLSQPGRPLQHAKLEGAERLLAEGQGPAVARCSTKHLAREFDGMYDPCLVLDFGRITTAFFELEVEGPAGGVIDIGYAERLTDGYFLNHIEGQFASRLVLRGGRQTFRTFNWLGFRFVKLRVRKCCEDVKIHAARAIRSRYPFEERGAFQSSDDALNRIWEISRYTIRLCSNEFLTDTPWREQGQWLGDVSAVTLGGIYACFGDTALPGKFLRQSAANQMPTGMITNMTNSISFAWQAVIPDYSLLWVIAAWEHYLYTGEERWVHTLYPTVLKVIYAFVDYLDEYGLVNDMPYWVLIDWAPVDVRGECAALNALFYAALAAADRMAEVKGDAYTRRLCQEVRAKMKANFHARLWDARKRCYADANIDGELSDKVSEHANALAILHDLCDAETAAAIVNSLYEERSVEFIMAEPYFTWQVLKALDHVGRFDLAIELTRRRWGRMVARGQSSCSEEWGRHGSWRSGEYGTFMRTESHAWSACPAEFLTKTLIGLEILEPGCRRVRVAPRDAAPETFRVVYPTPRGPIVVEKDASGLRVEAPEGVVVEE